MKRWNVREWKRLNRTLLYVFGIVLAITVMKFYDTKWSMQVDTQRVVVAARQIMPHERITEADLIEKKMKSAFAIPGAYDSLKEAVGKEALQLIEEGDQLTANRVDKTSLLKAPDATVMEIPDSWLLSVPGSLRRLDQVRFFAVPPKTAANGEEPDVAALQRQAVLALQDVVVAYYKDANSAEVQNGEGNVNPNLRLQSTVRGRKLEMELTEQQFVILSNYAEQGYQFIVGYRS